MKRAREQTKKLRTYLGRVLRNLERFVGPLNEWQVRLLVIARRIFEQSRERHGKCYSVHALAVACITKDKAHKRYEFGCKVSVVTINLSNWIVGIEAAPGNPYDGAILRPAVAQVEKLTRVKPTEAFVNRGYQGSELHPEGMEVYMSRRRNLAQVDRAAAAAQCD